MKHSFFANIVCHIAQTENLLSVENDVERIMPFVTCDRVRMLNGNVSCFSSNKKKETKLSARVNKMNGKDIRSKAIRRQRTKYFSNEMNCTFVWNIWILLWSLRRMNGWTGEQANKWNAKMALLLFIDEGKKRTKFFLHCHSCILAYYVPSVGLNLWIAYRFGLRSFVQLNDPKKHSEFFRFAKNFLFSLSFSFFAFCILILLSVTTQKKKPLSVCLPLISYWHRILSHFNFSTRRRKLISQLTNEKRNDRNWFLAYLFDCAKKKSNNKTKWKSSFLEHTRNQFREKLKWNSCSSLHFNCNL